MAGKPQKFPAAAILFYKNASQIPQKFSPAAGIFYRNLFSNVSNSKVFFAPAAGHHSLLCFMLVYKALLDKHKTLKCSPLQARKKVLWRHLLRGFLIFCKRLCTDSYHVRKVYSKHTSSPQARKFWVTIRLYKVFTVHLGLFLARRRRKFFGLPPQISRPWGGNFLFPPIFRDPGGEIFLDFPPTWGGKKNPWSIPILPFPLALLFRSIACFTKVRHI